MKQAENLTIHKHYRTPSRPIFPMYYQAAVLLINQIINGTNKLYTTGMRRFLDITISEPGRRAPIFPGSAARRREKNAAFFFQHAINTDC